MTTVVLEMLRVEEQDIQVVFEGQPLKKPPPDYPAPAPWIEGEDIEVIEVLDAKP